MGELVQKDNEGVISLKAGSFKGIGIFSLLFLFLFLAPCLDPLERMGDVETIPLEEFFEITRIEMRGVDSIIVNPRTDYTYFLDREAGLIHYLNEVFLKPRGEWCLGDETPDADCNGGQVGEDEDGFCICDDGGDFFTAGEIELGSYAAGFTLNMEGEELYVLLPERGEIAVVDIAPWGEEPYTFHRETRRIIVDSSQGCNYLSGPVDFDVDLGLIILSDSTACNSIALLSPETGEIVSDIPLAGRVRTLSYDTSAGLFILFEDSGDIALYSKGNYTLERVFDLPEGVSSFRYHPGECTLYAIEEGEPALYSADLCAAAGDAETTTLPFSPELFDLDEISGDLYFYFVGEEGNFVSPFNQGSLLEERLEVASLSLLKVHSPLHNIYILEEGGESGRECRILNNEKALLKRDSPMNLFLITFIERPFEDEMYLMCRDSEDGEKEVYQDILDRVKGNAFLLYTLDFPVAAGLSSDHIRKNDECKSEWVYDLLKSFGFEIGLLLHRSPCYNCTDRLITGGTYHYLGDICDDSSPFYCDPFEEDCCLPCEDDFCLRGEYECYREYMTAVVENSDLEYGEMSFVAGAHPQSTYSWDWIRFIREVERGDGGKGFPVVLFASASAYPDIGKFDPRAKDLAPFCPEDRNRTWSPPDYLHWDEDGGDESLLYLSGETVAVHSLSEWLKSGMYFTDFLNLHASTFYDEEDFDLLKRLLRNAVAHTSGRPDGVFYFHIPDMGSFDLFFESPETGDSAADLLEEFIRFVKGKYIANGLVKPSLPSAIREEVLKRR